MLNPAYLHRDISAPIAGRLKSLGYGLKEERGLLVALFTFLAVCADSALAPRLSTVAPAVSSGLFLILIFRCSGASDSSAREMVTVPVAAGRVLLFFAIHLVIVAASLKSGFW